MRDWGVWCRALRTEMGLSQQELARRAGLSRMYIYRLERGDYRSPRYQTIERLRSAFGTEGTNAPLP
jgi:transcriptional regulator with XRE-family HTH domain